jgi:DnaJ-class molecular chaperone
MSEVVDYYKVLNLDKSCTKEEVKKSYRKLALQHHPDKNNGSSSESFKLISEAYQILSDDQKRYEYDNGRSRSAKNSDFNGSFVDPNDLFRCNRITKTFFQRRSFSEFL